MAVTAAIGARLRTPLGIATASVTVVAVVAAAVMGAKVVRSEVVNIRTMCAEFTDAVGLYEGNKVALLGIEVGSMTAIVNKPDHVEVDFTVPADLDLPADVGAVTYSQSIVTDRHIELTKAYTGGPKFTGPGCIKLDATKTPVSISETFSAVGNLADAIIGAQPGQDPSNAPGVRAINDSLSAASRSLEGTGPGLNKTMRNLATMLADPYKADADYRRLFENSEILTSDFLYNWDSFASVIQTLPATTELVEGLSDNFGATLSYLSHLLPIIVEAMNRFGPRMYARAGGGIEWMRDLLNNHSPAILAMIKSWPQFTNWFADIYEPAWGTHNVTYIPPQVDIAPTQAGAICQALTQRNIPGAASACASGNASDPVTLGLTDLVLGAAFG
ncbi:ABC-type transport system involved in resistance to organic solvents, periplasmic component [Mycolicibacterium rhodesiae NBB3]|jgi:phospholipid/cholesterol/gamma-HCH transport system substrate-binding protein|uniref:ABC-type transport system involved in resistance to organic solvents, periplasmic component n=1 Tax=Mycolicibacterium rhodesiae (strain NBB3) TaxID=710685 RepID=G8RXW7_MYCRN|nr:MlaD family protein [Mycolicibacterium rhodesiae]AEV70660.1 ABC-type transport system involved in resistance to organic solvents, periplasmic component [Mycolicibacterium rhodesiae NBB3]